MTKFKILAIGTATLALSVAAAAPAAAQYAPQYYPQNGYQQPNSPGAVIGAIVNAVTGGYGQYPMGNFGYDQVSQRSLVQQCAIAAEHRLNSTYRSRAYNGNVYGQQAYGYQNQQPYGYQNQPYGYQNQPYGYQNQPYGYQNQPYGYQNQGYGHHNQDGPRVLGVTSVERRSYGGLRVRGVATSGNVQQGYARDAYGRQVANAQQADLSFSCRVNARGQVANVDIMRNTVGYRSRY